MRRPRRRLPLRHDGARWRPSPDGRLLAGRRAAHAHPPRPAHADDATQPARVARAGTGAGEPPRQRGADLRPIRIRPRRRLRALPTSPRERARPLRGARATRIDATAPSRRGARRRTAAVRACRPSVGRHDRSAGVDVEALPEGGDRAGVDAVRQGRVRRRAHRASTASTTATSTTRPSCVEGSPIAVHRIRHGARPVGRERRRRAGALAVPVRHRSRHDVAGRGTTGQRSDPARAARRTRLRDAGDLDEQWVRLLDVDAALTARTYGPCSTTVTIAVTDPLIEDNNDRWAISAGGAKRTSDPADLIVDIARCRPRTWAVSRGATSRRQGCCRSTSSPVDPRHCSTRSSPSDPTGYCGSFF